MTKVCACVCTLERERDLMWKVFVLPWVAQSSCCSQVHQTDTRLFHIQHLGGAVEAQTLKAKVKKNIMIFQYIIAH